MFKKIKLTTIAFYTLISLCTVIVPNTYGANPPVNEDESTSVETEGNQPPQKPTKNLRSVWQKHWRSILLTTALIAGGALALRGNSGKKPSTPSAGSSAISSSSGEKPGAGTPATKPPAGESEVTLPNEPKLVAPDTFKSPTANSSYSITDIDLQNGKFDAAAFATKGNQDHMEDFYAISPNIDMIPGQVIHPYFAIFDGHNGAQTADYLSKELHHTIAKYLHNGLDPQRSITNAFLETDKLLVSALKKVNDKSGSSAIVGLIENGKLFIAVLGDSVAILARKDIAPFVSQSHTSANETEMTRISEAGGFVYQKRISHPQAQGGLVTSRCFGDFDIKAKTGQLYIAEPSINVIDLKPEDEFLILGSRGMSEYIAPEEAIKFVKERFKEGKTPGEISKELTDYLLKAKKSPKNITTIIVRFKDFQPDTPAPHKTTHLSMSMSQVSLEAGTFGRPGRKKKDEDKTAMAKSNKLFAVAIYDGHGGKEAAEYASKHFFDDLAKVVNERGLNEESLIEAVTKHDKALLKNISGDSGSCAIIAIVQDGEKDSDPATLFVANVGDSRAVLSSSGKAIDLSKDQKATDENERKRIRDAGSGHYLSSNRLGNIAVTRALGDREWADQDGNKTILIATPEVTKHTITAADEFLILGCDGIWDVMSSQYAVDFVKKAKDAGDTDPVSLSTKLVNHTINDRGSGDDVTASILLFDHKKRAP